MTAEVAQTDTHKPLTARQAFWQSHLDACRREGVSLARYAKQRGLPVASLYAARFRLKSRRGGASAEQDVRPLFLPVKLSAPATHSPVSIRVTLTNGVVVDIPDASTPHHCQVVLESAGRLA
jgi:hypothetical protein